MSSALTIETSMDKGFKDMTMQFIQACIGAWPEDPLLPIALVEFEKLDESTALALFQEHFDSYMEGLAKKDLETLWSLGEHPVLVGLNIKEKYTTSNASTQDTLWSYIGHLCRFSGLKSLYKFIPQNVIDGVTVAAQALKDDLESGRIDVKTVNPMELGQKVMSQFKPEEIESMMTKLTSDPKAMAIMMAQMTSMMESKGGLESMLNFLPK